MTKNDNAFVEPLTQRLKGNLKTDEIAKLAKLVSTIHEHGIKVDDVFPFGIPAQPDSVSIRAHLTPEQLEEIGKLLPKLGPVRDFRVFPRGIVLPESYRLHINVNR